MSVSEEIKKRLQDAGKRFHSNDNISEYIKEGELDKLQAEVQEKFYEILQTLVIDTKFFFCYDFKYPTSISTELLC